MKSLSLTARLSLLISTTVLLVMILTGMALYQSLAQQISVRDDAALLNRMDQIRTLLLNEDVLELIRTKPRLFANMLGNTESLLVLRFPGQPPLIEVNPGKATIPDIPAVPAQQPLALKNVRHELARDGTPFISASALAKTRNGPGEVEIITGRLMTERTSTLAGYRHQMLLLIIVATAIAALSVAFLTRRGLRPLHRLAQETAAIDVRHLAWRIRPHHVPRELLALVAAFNQMLDRLETSFQQLSQVSADMAHDLRTPIANLLGQTEVALTQARSLKYYETLLGSNFEELLRLSRMIDSMLFLAQAQDASQAIHCEQVNLATVLPPLADYFEGPAEERQLTMVYPTEGTLWADGDLLRRALANLLANAIRFAQSGSTIRVSVQTQREGVTLSVENHGDTIAAAQQARIFDRFYRVDASRHDSATGSGLGLSIVRSIMQLHHGHCAVVSQDRLTRFTLFFPSRETP
ncbi:Putative sensor protein [Sodalis praecaptivus]|uniref:Sensor protein n=1 Tax=Sodalis praecaptivus TaxID=1239307 RepID=W0HXW6_9GAMM|nr:heavy metal sensor histidine kinase [Sodalis praecaptivus]AHF77362.1 Putative sensor protein [Sodalis praecaptivus]